MTDSIRTNTFTSNQQVTGTQATAYEQNLESQTVSNVNEDAISDVVIKQLGGQQLSAADAQTLMDSAKGLTAQDIDALVASGKINRQEGDALLLASTLSAFDEGNTTAGDVATAMNKFYSMSQADQQATLNTFANQGSYERNMALEFNDDGTLKSATYQLSVNGEDLGPGDLPSTPDIQRAALFLMSPSSDPTMPGAITSFTKWEFNTSTDQMSAMLGSLPNYENLSANEKAEMVNYLASAGYVAAGNPNAAAVSPERRAELEADQKSLTGRESDYDKMAQALELALSKDSHVKLKNVKVTLDNGTEMSLLEFAKTRNISMPNIDGDNKVNQTEGQALLDNIKGHKDILTEQRNINAAELNGADADTLKKLEANFQEKRETEVLLEAMRSNRFDWKGGEGKDYNFGFYQVRQTKLELKDLTFKVATRFDENGELLADGKTRTVEYNAKDYMTEHNIGFSDKGNTAGMVWKHSDNDFTLGKEEQDYAIANLQDHLNDLNNESTLIKAESKADWPGGQALIDQMDANANLQSDWEAALAVLTMANQDNNFKGVDADDAKFTDSSGNLVSASDFLKDQGVDLSVMKKNGKIGQKDFENLRDNVIPGKLNDVKSAGEAIAKQLDDLQPPAPPPTGPRNTDGGNGMNVIGSGNGGVSGTDNTQAEINRLIQMKPEDMTLQEKQFLVNNTLGDIQNSQNLNQDGSYDYDTAVGQIQKDWSATEKRGFDSSALDEGTAAINKGEAPPPNDFAKFGFSDGELVDIGMLMYMVMSDRLSMLGDQIKSIIQEQQKNTNDQKDMNSAIAALNTGGDKVNLKETTFTKSDGTQTNLADYFDSAGVKYDNKDGDFTLGKEEIQTAIANCKGTAEGLSNEGQQILNELTQLSQKYQQAQSLEMNFLEKWDAMKQRIIDKIRAN